MSIKAVIALAAALGLSGCAVPIVLGDNHAPIAADATTRVSQVRHDRHETHVAVVTSRNEYSPADRAALDKLVRTTKGE